MFALVAGIYIHIPFCRKACHYCNFHFSTSFRKKDELITALIKELSMQSGYLAGHEIGTIYFGGGTPSAMPSTDIRNILDTIRNTFTVSPDAEITLEANPDDIQAEILTDWKTMGINRLSIGIQAFQDELLKAWNRSHSSEQALRAIRLSQEAGFNNITADLIYGGPGLTDEDWRENIQKLLDFGIPHLSCYALTVERGTALAYQIEKGRVAAPDDEQSNRQFVILQDMLTKAGFEQYEVSNFSLPGMESKHNMSYWSGALYLGVGPSAHSFNSESRQWNVSNTIKYIQAIQEGNLPFEKEMLTDVQRFNELVMTGLRTSRGIDKESVKALGDNFSIYLDSGVSAHPDQIIKNESGNWALKPAYYFFADGIAADLFLTISPD